MISEFHGKAISAIPGARVVAVFSRDAAKARRRAEQLGARAYADYGEFLKDEDLAIVSICTPSGAHLEPAVAAARAGKHVMNEKPVEVTLERADAIIAACERAGVKLGVIFQSRFSEAAGLLKRAIDAGRFGRLTLGDAYVKWHREQSYYDSGAWRGTKALDGGGALINQSIHAVDLLQWLMGPVGAVAAFAGRLIHERIEVEDAAVAAVRFANGALGAIEGTTSVWPGHLKRIEIGGSAGSAVIEEESILAWKFKDERPEDALIRGKFASATTSGGGAGDPAAINFTGHRRQFEDFMRAIETDGSPLVDGPEGRKALEVVLAIYESARTGRVVELPLKARRGGKRRGER